MSGLRLETDSVPASSSQVAGTVGFVLLLAAVLATLATWSMFGGSASADDILPAVISRQRITLYFWGQNRLGNLLPLLAAPVHDLYANLALQYWLRGFAAALSPLLPLLLVRPRLTLPVAFAAALVAGFALISPAVNRMFWIWNTPFAVAMALAGVALLIESRAPLRAPLRFAAVLALLLVATWVNAALALTLVPMLALLLLMPRQRRALVVLLVASVICYFVVSRQAATMEFNPHYAQLRLELASLEGLARALGRAFPGPSPWLLAAALVFAALVARARPALRPTVQRALLVVAGCVVTIFVTGLLDWFATNDYSARYICAPVLVITQVAGLVVAEAVCVVLPSRGRRRWWISAAAAAAITLAVVVGRVVPGPHRPIVSPASADLATIAVARQARFIAGNYWVAWPAVFEALHREAPRQVYGLIYRGEELSDLIAAAAVDGAVVVCADADPDICRKLFRAGIRSRTFAGREVADVLAVIDQGTFGPDASPFLVLQFRL